MIILLLIWCCLAIVCWCLGTLVLELISEKDSFHGADRFFISQWLGIVILANLLLVISFFTPLTTAVGITLSIGSIGTVILWRKTRLKLQELIKTIDRRSIVIGLVFGILISAFSSIATIWYDTGLYHYQVIKWLASFGTVPGLGLVHHRFSFSATFFTIPAVLEQGILTNRATGVLSGFVITIFVGQLLASVRKITNLTIEKNFSDYFLFTYSGYSIITICLYSFGVLRSPSPDTIVALMSGIPLWVMLFNWQSVDRSQSLIAVLLASGLVSFKLSGLLILVIVYGWAILNLKRGNWREFLFNATLVSLTALLPLIPALSYGFITSGCPLFPSSILCMDVPWGVGKARAEEVRQIITNFQKWGTVTPPDSNPFGWLIPWARREGQATVQIFISLVFSFLLVGQSAKNSLFSSIKKYVLAMGIGGIVYMMLLSPSIRFGIGYLTIIPAFWFAGFVSLRTFRKRWEVGVWIVLVVLWLVPTVRYRSTDFFYRVGDLAMPDPLPQLSQLESKRAVEFDYLFPKNGDDRCWLADLPCTPENQDGVRLLNPDRGLAGGFRRAD